MVDIRCALVLLACCGLLVGCKKEEAAPPQTGQDTGAVGDALENAGAEARKAAEDAAGDVAAKGEELKAQAVAAAEDQLTQLESKLKDLRTRLEAATPEVKAVAQPLVDAASAQFTGVGDKVTALKAAGLETWESASTELTAAVNGLKQAIAEAASKLGG